MYKIEAWLYNSPLFHQVPWFPRSLYFLHRCCFWTYQGVQSCLPGSCSRTLTSLFWCIIIASCISPLCFHFPQPQSFLQLFRVYAPSKQRLMTSTCLKSVPSHSPLHNNLGTRFSYRVPLSCLYPAQVQVVRAAVLALFKFSLFNISVPP